MDWLNSLLRAVARPSRARENADAVDRVEVRCAADPTVSPAFIVWCMRRRGVPPELAAATWVYAPSELLFRRRFNEWPAQALRSLPLYEVESPTECVRLLLHCGEGRGDDGPLPCACSLLPGTDKTARARAFGAALSDRRSGLRPQVLGAVIGDDKTWIKYCGEDCADAVQAGFFSRMLTAGEPLLPWLRRVLHSMQMPGSSQLIQRLVWSISVCWFEANKEAEYNPFADGEAAFVFAIAVLMLSSDRRAECSQRRMPEDAFIRNMKGLNGGSDFPHGFLRAAYDDVVRQPVNPVQFVRF